MPTSASGPPGAGRRRGEDRQPVQVPAVPVQGAADHDGRPVVLGGDGDAQRAHVPVGHAGQPQRLQPGAATTRVAEHGAAPQQSLTKIEHPLVGHHGAGLHIEAYAGHRHLEGQPVRSVDQVDDRRVVAVVDAGEIGAGQLAAMALLERAAGPQVAVPDREQGLGRVSRGRVEYGLGDQPLGRAQLVTPQRLVDCGRHRFAPGLGDHRLGDHRAYARAI